MIPSKKQCLKLIKSKGMLHNIIEHSLMVHRVAITLTQLLNSNGCRLNVGLVEAGALLHDITKTRALQTGENHSQTGALLLEQLGYGEVAELVARHVNLDSGQGTDPHISEAMVVNYADKRVMHDRMVDLEKRFEDILKRYGTKPERVERIRNTKIQAQEIERKIFSHLDITPQQLETLIHEEN